MERTAIAHLRRALGPLILGLIEDRQVTDLYLNEPDHMDEPGMLWVGRLGQAPEIVGAIDAGQAMNIVTAVAGTLDTYINADKPFVEGELFGNGPRFDGIIPPYTLAPVFAIRVPASRVFTLAEYVAAGVMTASQAARIERAVVNREHIAVVGQTGAGKTTLLNAIGDAVTRLTPDDRMLIIEGTRELNIAQRNRLRIRTGPAMDDQAALRRALRQVPDRIWVGEVRGAETHAMIMLWNTGHRGGACTFHSDIASPEEALLRVEQMVSLATLAPQQSVIARTINLIVCIARDDQGRRRVTQIATVQGWDREREAYQTTLEN